MLQSNAQELCLLQSLFSVLVKLFYYLLLPELIYTTCICSLIMTVALAGRTNEIHKSRRLDPLTPLLTPGHLLRVLRVSHGATAGQYCFTWSFPLSFHVLPLSPILAFYSFLFPIHIQLPHPVPSALARILLPAAVDLCLLLP